MSLRDTSKNILELSSTTEFGKWLDDNNYTLFEGLSVLDIHNLALGDILKNLNAIGISLEKVAADVITLGQRIGQVDARLGTVESNLNLRINEIELEDERLRSSIQDLRSDVDRVSGRQTEIQEKITAVEASLNTHVEDQKKVNNEFDVRIQLLEERPEVEVGDIRDELEMSEGVSMWKRRLEQELYDWPLIRDNAILRKVRYTISINSSGNDGAWWASMANLVPGVSARFRLHDIPYCAFEPAP